MQPEVSDLTGSFEALLATSIAELTTEFRNHEVADLVALIRLDRMATLQSLLDFGARHPAHRRFPAITWT